MRTSRPQRWRLGITTGRPGHACGHHAQGRSPASARLPPAGSRAAPAFQKPGGGHQAPRHQAGPGRQHLQRHSNLTRGDVPAAPERTRPRKPLWASGRPRDRFGGGDTVTCRRLGRSLSAPLSWQPRKLHGGRKPEGLVTAPREHRASAHAHAGVDVDDLDLRPWSFTGLQR